MTHAHHDDFINEKTDDDRRRAQQHIVDEAHHDAQARILAVFRQIRPREHADRRTDQNTEQRHDGAAVQRIEQSAPAAGRRRHLRKKIPGHAGDAMGYQRPQDRRQASEPRKGRNQRQSQEGAVFNLAETAPVHSVSDARRSILRSIAWAAAMTENVIRNSNNPNAISDEVYRSPTASVNSLAI